MMKGDSSYGMITDILFPSKDELTVLNKFIYSKSFYIVDPNCENSSRFKKSLKKELNILKNKNEKKRKKRLQMEEAKLDKLTMEKEREVIKYLDLPIRSQFKLSDVVNVMNKLDYVLLDDDCVIPRNKLKKNEKIEDLLTSGYFRNMFFCHEEYKRGAKLSEVFNLLGYKIIDEYNEYDSHIQIDDDVYELIKGNKGE